MYARFFSSKSIFPIKEKAYTQIYKEICYRAWYLLLCFILSCISSWIYAPEVLYLYLSPLYNLSQNIIFTSISEAFYTTIYLCVLCGFASSIPFCIYLFVCFFLPSLFPREKKLLYILYFWVQCFYILSLWLSSIYIIPELCVWFLKYGGSSGVTAPTNYLYLSLQAKVSSYVSWSVKIYTFSVVILQIPIVLTVLFYKYQKVFYVFFLQNRKYTSICILLFCAAVSPPDIYSQGFLFLFFMGVFELILWFYFLQNALKQKNYKKSKFLTGINP